MRVWMAQGSLSGGRLDPVGEKIALDLTATRRRAERAQRIRHARRDEVLRRVRLGAEADDSGRWQALCLLDVARPEVRRGAQLWVMVRWQGVDTAGEPWADSCVPVKWLTGDWVQCARAMERLRYAKEEPPPPPPAKAARRSSRLAQWSAPAMPTSDEARGDLAAKVSVVLGAHLLGYVDVGVPATRGTAAALGRVQTGEVEQEIIANMWEDWGLRSALEESVESPRAWAPGGLMPVRGRAGAQNST